MTETPYAYAVQVYRKRKGALVPSGGPVEFRPTATFSLTDCASAAENMLRAFRQGYGTKAAVRADALRMMPGARAEVISTWERGAR